jgi:hypothetical protein
MQKKTFDKNSTSLYDKILEETRDKKNVFQHNKDYI